MTAYGRLFLIPSTLGETDPREVIPSPVLALLPGIDRYVVENIRSARRYLSAAGLRGQIDGLSFTELSEHTSTGQIESMLSLFEDGHDVGLISEAGLPAVADPGAGLVALCHRHGIEVVPQVGPSSLMLALMGSGLNGQQFAFRGYIPAKTDQRRNAIAELEKTSARLHQTQIFIETPYRNDTLLQDLLNTLKGNTMLCLACDITLPDQSILTSSVAQWRSQKPVIGKRPCVFLILAQ